MFRVIPNVRRGPRTHDRRVANETRVIHLELSLAGESLTGCARDDLGASREFDGRLGLLAAIDTLIEVHPDRDEAVGA